MHLRPTFTHPKVYFRYIGITNVIEIEGLLFLGFGKRRRSMDNWFFQSSDVTRALNFFQLKSSIFERPHDVTWWEKPVFHGAPAFAKTRPNPGNSKPSISISWIWPWTIYLCHSWQVYNVSNGWLNILTLWSRTPDWIHNTICQL